MKQSQFCYCGTLHVNDDDDDKELSVLLATAIAIRPIGVRNWRVMSLFY